EFTSGLGAASRGGDGIDPTAGPAMMSGLSAHMPTLRSDTSMSVATPLRSRWKRAMPTAPAIVFDPCRSKKAAGWYIGSASPRDILNAIDADAHAAARSKPPVSAIGPRAPHPDPRT